MFGSGETGSAGTRQEKIMKCLVSGGGGHAGTRHQKIMKCLALGEEAPRLPDNRKS